MYFCRVLSKKQMLVFLCCFLLTAGPSKMISISYAQSAGENPTTLKLFLTEALENNRNLKEAKELLAAAKHRIPQASALPDPTAGTDYMGEMLETRLGPQENTYEFEQMIPFPGKLLEKRQMAKAEFNAAQANVKKTERDVIFNVSETYFDLYATDKTIATVEETLALLKNFEAIAQNRYASQSGSQRDVAKAQTEVSDTLQKLFVLRQQRNTLQAMLNSLLNRNPGSEIKDLTNISISPLSLNIDELTQMTKENQPDLKEAQAMLKRQEHANTLAKYEYAPDFSVGFKYYDIGNGMTTDPEDGRDAWMIPIKVTLPLWQNRIIPAVQEAKRNLNAAQARFEQTKNTIEYEIRDAFYRFTASQQTVELYENAFLPEAELAFRSDQAGYEAGKVDILNLIDSERVYLNSKIAYYQSKADALKSFAALERAVGIDLVETKP